MCKLFLNLLFFFFSFFYCFLLDFFFLVFRTDLCKGQISRVKITNYRKNGTTFKNLISMRPVYDSDQIYRFVIGIQFEIVDNVELGRRLYQLNKLIHLLPCSLPLRSKATARTNGTLCSYSILLFFLHRYTHMYDIIFLHFVSQLFLTS